MSVLPSPPSPTTIGRAIARTGKYYGSGLAKSLFTLPIFIWAQAIAFKVFITLLPLILLATGVFGLVLRQDEPSRIVTDFLRDFLPAGQSEPLVNLVQQLQSASGGLTFVGAGAFLVTVITLLSTLRYVIGMAMGGDRHQMRSILKGYVFDMRMVLQVGSLFLISFALTVGTQIARQYGAEWGLSTAFLDQFTEFVLTKGLPFTITLGMIVQLYYFIPRPHPPWRSAIWGASVSAVLFESAKNGFAIYATHIGKFDRYAASGKTTDATADVANAVADAASGVADAAGGASDSLGGLGGAFGLILAFVFWVYLSGLILVIGAVVTTLHEKRHRPRRNALRRIWKRFGIRRHSAHPEGASDTTADADASGGSPASGDGAATPEATPGLPAPAPLPLPPEASGGPQDPEPVPATPPASAKG
ncbi:YihY/virulence factor BrkB family protein [Rubricoccus marinus]|uniref:YihY/virulence factor BrkB family protein n=1 Tax=Rubricoccus marinus TaxID=716817 RepID=A0A259TVJ1_9BACT|nr:YihY/virulence factor BrkB family protein [Rubricoccus marinus]OZC01782.1 hypothetical protein BSZ36_01535 [Rubricoccus marinus]